MKNEVERLLNDRGIQIGSFKESKLNLELDMKYICKDTIKKRKSIYGNNFPDIAKMQSEYLEVKISPKDIAMSLAILKKVRVDFIKSKLQEIKENEDFTDIFVLEKIKNLNTGLEDSQKDMMNYLWVFYNYEEYESL